MSGTERRRPTPLLVVGAILPLLVVAGVAGAWLSGIRFFVVETPSMGTTAPVGSLVVDRPLGDVRPRVGEVVTYRPPVAGSASITHRVVASDPEGVRTRGDLNGEADPWTIPLSAVVGRAVLIVPGAGWLLRALPLLAVGVAAVLLLSMLLRRPEQRTALRMLGFSVVVAGTIAWLRPLLNAAVLTSSASAGGLEARVVSTGLLPVRVSVGSASVHLTSGQSGTLLLPLSDTGRYSLATAIDVGPLGWALLVAACAAPVLWTVVAGPTRRTEEGTAA
jgi:signal peptidase I